MPDPIRYRVVPVHPEAHLLEVSCTVAAPAADGQRFALPAWIPGSYMIREFARNIVSLSAEADGRPVAVTKLDKHTWQCAPCAGPLTVRYQVYAWDLSVRAAHVDTSHAYFNGASVFLAAEGFEHHPCEVELLRPAGSRYAAWRVGTALPRLDAPLYGFGTYRAVDYADLIDHPVEMGEFALTGFEAGGVAHDIVVYGRQRADLARLAADLQRICEAQIALFGALPPMARYVFMVMAVGEGYGGLEHRASCSLICKRSDLPQPGVSEIGNGYRTFLGLCSHEYFHTWNVKAIKPAAFVPYDLSRENYTRQLWAFEGITSYYDDLFLARSRLITADSYLELLGQTATRVWRTPGRFKQSVAESSFDTWIKFYRQDENSPNAIVSYYAKGALVALALDLTLRRLTQGARSLDDLMRLLWERYGQTGRGVPEPAMAELAAEIAGQALDDFFDRYVHGTEDPPLDELLAAVGVAFALRPAEGPDDKGGRPARRAPRAALGVASAADAAGAKLLYVFDGSPAQQAGLSAGDVIIAVDGLKAAKDNLAKLIEAHEPGATVTIHAFRRDELMRFACTLQAPASDTCVLTLQSDADAATLERRNAWLQG